MVGPWHRNRTWRWKTRAFPIGGGRLGEKVELLVGPKTAHACPCLPRHRLRKVGAAGTSPTGASHVHDIGGSSKGHHAGDGRWLALQQTGIGTIWHAGIPCWVRGAEALSIVRLSSSVAPDIASGNPLLQSVALRKTPPGVDSTHPGFQLYCSLDLEGVLRTHFYSTGPDNQFTKDSLPTAPGCFITPRNCSLLPRADVDLGWATWPAIISAGLRRPAFTPRFLRLGLLGYWLGVSPVQCTGHLSTLFSCTPARGQKPASGARLGAEERK
jgi:hypothetical protein